MFFLHTVSVLSTVSSAWFSVMTQGTRWGGGGGWGVGAGRRLKRKGIYLYALIADSQLCSRNLTQHCKAIITHLKIKEKRKGSSQPSDAKSLIKGRCS